MKKLFLLAALFTFPLLSHGEDSPPDSFMKLEVGVLRHYGSTSGYGFSLRQYADAMRPAGGTQEWKRDNDKQWTQVITINDNATGTKQRMALVFKEDGKYASIIRFVDNDKEVTKDFVGTAADQIMIPISQKLASGTKSPITATKNTAKKGGPVKKSTLAGTYGDEQYKVTLEETNGSFTLQLAGRCMDKDSNIKSISLKSEAVKFKRGEDEFEEVASIDSQECKLDLVAVKDNGTRELRITESNNCCQNFLTNILIKNK